MNEPYPNSEMFRGLQLYQRPIDRPTHEYLNT